MENMKRTATCGELNSSRVGETVTLNGWVHRNRDHGGILFINLRDRYGITQVVIDEDASAPLKEKAKELKFEYCIAVVGIVRRRPDEMVNKDMNTGEIEVAASQIEILTKCDVLPFMIDEKSDAKEDLRLKYRYLDLRSFSMQRKIRLRTDVTFAAREFLIGKGFMEIETPTMIKSTPEGARDFLVPSRIHAGKFYALPQSPQLYKQILMVSGFDRYFQIAHCFRDEDARGDRQPEHTQIDMEMSFVSKDDVFEVVEGMMSHIFDKTLGVKLEIPFQRLPYDDALNRFGSDKPDLRFGLEMKTVDELASKSGFNAFKSVIAEGGCVKALVASGCAGYSRKQISELEDAAKVYGAKGLAWMKVGESGIEGGVSKFFDGIADELLASLEAQEGDLILMVGDKWNVACTSLGAVRSKLGKDLGLIEAGTFRFCWIVDFPLFEYNEEEQRWEAAHHMFTMPQEQYLDTLEENPGAVKGDLYDLVCNGFELASGSIRIHDPEIQKRIFNIVGFSSEEAENRFGFLLNAFRYGPPPHGGIAPGLDRLVMIMAGENSIKEVIAFPKNNQAYSPMDDSPSLVDEDQLKMLHIKLDMPEKEEES
ncbi:aspartate--tRNA ligase [Sediminispirochaeta smaragdinae]|uniref:Aspartate--tRNA(Asp/Asn) ligase n=1 Tax=Sediminispirochaeta smaragdinae (strain DSM 11293 / JCM 15392 / SEBR 4228) TaxID=573413 RepID=E1RAH7_SEDSS|nr:aspartate--tRNA ligase [Sediminispirochaeta smaragdinae]ADK79468.1 aspartyl-tRNA synthetase [Sediminispirochaeta smaragdinae DSM 11293]